MTPNELATKAAEEVMRTIEREKRIIKASIAEAIEKVILTTQMTPAGDAPAPSYYVATSTGSAIWTTTGSTTGTTPFALSPGTLVVRWSDGTVSRFAGDTYTLTTEQVHAAQVHAVRRDD